MIFNRRHILLRSAALAAATLPCTKGAWALDGGPQSGGARPPGAGLAAVPDPVILLEAHALPSPEPASHWPELAYGSASPGPILRLKKGAPTRIRLTNRTDEATSLDWHGMRLPNALETVQGLVGTQLEPGGVAEILLTPIDSGTSWFHPGLLLSPADQTARGLAGVVIVEEPDAPSVDADKVLIMTDGPDQGGAPGCLLLDGKTSTEVDTYVPGARLRLRIVNGSTSKAFAVSFQGGAAMVIAIDGQPSELFKPLNGSIPVGPGARFDVLVDLPGVPEAEFKLLVIGTQTTAGPQARVVYVAKTAGTPAAPHAPMHPLTPNAALPRAIALEHAARVDMTVRMEPGPHAPKSPAWSINGVLAPTLSKTPLFRVKRNSPVTLGFTNASAQLTAFRLHGHVMRLLHAMDDGWEPYWRDSVLVPPGVTHHVAFLADNPGKWLIESPFFDQAAGGLRTWFEVA